MSVCSESYTVLTREDEVAEGSRTTGTVTSTMIDLASVAATAINVGVDLAANHLNAEAIFHFQLALEKVIDIRSYGILCDPASASKNSSKTPQALEGQSIVVDYPHIRGLNELGTIDPPANSVPEAEFMIWMKCASLLALRNAALTNMRQDRSRDVNKILDATTSMLEELEEAGPFKDSFYQGRAHHVVLGMSLRLLQGERLLDTAKFLSTFSERRRKLKVHEAMKQYAHAVDLGRAYFEQGAKENSYVAQSLSRLGFCLLMEGEESLASVVYEVASFEYSHYGQDSGNSNQEDQDSIEPNNPFVVLGAPAA